MSGIPARILVDTCVWVDNYVGFRPGHRDACAFIDLADELGVTLVYAVTSIKDVYYAVGRVLKAAIRQEGASVTDADLEAIDAIAWSCVENMEEIATAVGIDASDIWLAKKYRSIHRDFEDDVVIAAAKRAKVDFLVTNDLQLRRNAPVAAVSTTDALALLRSFAMGQ